jgi:Ca-activated chloride channel family protein
MTRIDWRLGVALLAGALSIAIGPSPASAWELFRSENPDVRDGNERLTAGDAEGAVAAYDRAVATLPGEPAVRLDRGLALLAAGRMDEAREELLRATEPPASAEIRGAAHYDLGLAFYQQGDAAATAGEHEEAQRLFREAADAFRSSLRQVPGNRDAGWNLELALRRIREQEEQQQQQEEQEEQEQQDQQDQQQQDQQDQQQQDQQDQQQDQQDQQEGDQDQQDPQDQQQQDPQDQQQQDQQDPQQDQQDDSTESGERDDQQEQDSQDAQQQPGEGEQGSEEGESEGDDESQSTGTTERSLPPDMERVLDALQDGEENLERSLARSRGQREQRRVARDW